MDRAEALFDSYVSSDLQTKDFLLSFFDQAAPLTIFDIGACEGEDSIRYSRLFPNSSVYSFEPVAENIQKIQANLKRYGTKNIRLMPKALGAAAGKQTIYLSSGQPEDSDPAIDRGNKSSSIFRPGESTKRMYPWLKFENEREIECETLAGFCIKEHVRTIDFIHMDVQGAELLVLEGAGKMMGEIKAIWLEVSNSEFYENQPLAASIKAFMKKNGFIMLVDELRNGSYGDQLYLNMRHFSKVQFLSYRAKMIFSDIASRIPRYSKKIWRMVFLRTEK